MGADSKLESIFVYPTDGEAYMELSFDHRSFAEIRIVNGEMVVDFVADRNVTGVPASWIQSKI